nr:MAG TPA: hypothetical protein [Caudoviricetes sp.]DAS29992.1 MAG TPA: hypothetical protein [Caudoviricetes sp.]
MIKIYYCRKKIPSNEGSFFCLNNQTYIRSYN